jgi:hypothetical protein
LKVRSLELGVGFRKETGGVVAGGNVKERREFLAAAGKGEFTAVGKAAAGGIGERGGNLPLNG